MNDLQKIVIRADLIGDKCKSKILSTAAKLKGRVPLSLTIQPLSISHPSALLFTKMYCTNFQGSSPWTLTRTSAR